jgi:S1-C subfamily serine protease
MRDLLIDALDALCDDITCSGSTSMPVIEIGPPVKDPEAEQTAARLFDEFKDSAVEVSRYNWRFLFVPTAYSSGSGFFVRSGSESGKGYCDVATMDHVIEGLNGTPYVKTSDQVSHAAKILKEDTAAGIALLRIEDVKDPEKNCRTIPLATEPEPLIHHDLGVKISTDGKWHGDYGRYNTLVSRSTFRMPSSPGLDMTQSLEMFRMPGSPGDSGAAILSTGGKAVGITEGGGWGQTVAVPSLLIQRNLDETR